MNKYDKQVQEWVKGNPIHLGTRKDGTCCPDFSCCRPDLLASDADRKKFAEAHFRGDEKTTHKMLMGFLGGAVAKATDKKVHIAGQEPPE